MDYPDWANDHADEFEAIKAEMQELAVEMLAKKTYTFYEEFVDELFETMRKDHKNLGFAIMQPGVVSPDMEKIGIRVDLEDANDEDGPCPYMELGLAEVVSMDQGGGNWPFTGILLPFQPLEYTRCRLYKDNDGMIFDVPEKTYSIRTAVNCAGFWMSSEHNWDTNAMNIVRRAYRCAMGNDPLGKIFAIAMDHSNASPTIKYWDSGHWSLDPDGISTNYVCLNEFDMTSRWRNPDYHLSTVFFEQSSQTPLLLDRHYWKINLDSLTMNADEFLETCEYGNSWYSKLSIVHPSAEFSHADVAKEYAKLRTMLKGDGPLPFRELLDYIFDGKWLE